MLLLMVSGLLASRPASASPCRESSPCRGFPVGNFGICGEIHTTGEFLPGIMVNPSEEGPWLQRSEGGRLVVEADGVALATEEFARIAGTRSFPFTTMELHDPRLPGLVVELEAFSPVIRDNAFDTSLPVILAAIRFSNKTSRSRRVAARFEAQPSLDTGGPIAGGESFAGMAGGSRFAFAFAGLQTTALGERAVQAEGEVPAGESCVLALAIAYHHPAGYYGDRLHSPFEICSYALDTMESLRDQTKGFSELLPRTGDDELDEYLRWYIAAGVYLTRITGSIVITMGYCELNQRDSFWTSWLHLLYWPELERRMIELSAAHVRPDGKVPTTILPIIEREDDLDINCYFILRVARYFRHTRGSKIIATLWPDIRRAVEWLIRRDTDGDGLVEQQSFWGDWKDVGGVEGRLHAPHFEFTWLAALEAAAEMAEAAGDTAFQEVLGRLSKKAAAALHAPLEEGGLWNGRFYTSRWRDGREDNHVQQDQLVGALYGLIPADRLRSIYESMQDSLAPWGVRETYPYRDDFGYDHGDYHNGGVWPYLSFMDAAGRYINGYPEQAEEVMRRVSRWDLVEFGDWTPHEYLLGTNGENRGPIIQGWNADYIAAVVWGLFGLRVTAPYAIELAPKPGGRRDVNTPLILPWGILRVGITTDSVWLTSECDSKLTIRFGWWHDQEAPADAQNVGTGAMTWREVTLMPGESKGFAEL